jgi:membrane associated rhomboid family serine protease
VRVAGAAAGTATLRGQMLIPIRDENPTSQRAWVTLGLIAVNVVVFLLWQPTFKSETVQQEFFFCHAEIPWETTHQESLGDGGAEARRAIEDDLQIGPGPAAGFQSAYRRECGNKSWWMSIFVAMFLHGGWLHIGGNMLCLWIFGNNVEDKIGRVKYLLFYLASGIAAAALQTATSPDSVIPSLGASGAIAGVLGAYLVMFPRRKVLSIVPIFFFASLIALPAVVVLGFWFVLQFFSGATSLAQHVTSGVAYFAHVGGFAFGLVMAFLLFPKEWRRPRPREADHLPPW